MWRTTTTLIVGMPEPVCVSLERLVAQVSLDLHLKRISKNEALDSSLRTEMVEAVVPQRR